MSKMSTRKQFRRNYHSLNVQSVGKSWMLPKRYSAVRKNTSSAQSARNHLRLNFVQFAVKIMRPQNLKEDINLNNCLQFLWQLVRRRLLKIIKVRESTRDPKRKRNAQARSKIKSSNSSHFYFAHTPQFRQKGRILPQCTKICFDSASQKTPSN